MQSVDRNFVLVGRAWDGGCNGIHFMDVSNLFVMQGAGVLINGNMVCRIICLQNE